MTDAELDAIRHAFAPDGKTLQQIPLVLLVASTRDTERLIGENHVSSILLRRVLEKKAAIADEAIPALLAEVDRLRAAPASEPEPLPELWTEYAVSAWLGMASNRVRRMARRGEIPCRVLPNEDLVFDRAELAEWYANLARRPASEPSQPKSGPEFA